MSARAAWRLEDLGFNKVFRYTAGKLDWLAHGLPAEGEFARSAHVGDLACCEVPTCCPEDKVSEVGKRVYAAGWDVCVVVNEARVVLGLLRGPALAADAGNTAEDVMELAPRTYRPYVSPETALGYMQKNSLDCVLVTDSDGVLWGTLSRADAERVQANQPDEE